MSRSIGFEDLLHDGVYGVEHWMFGDISASVGLADVASAAVRGNGPICWPSDYF